MFNSLALPCLNNGTYMCFFLIAVSPLQFLSLGTTPGVRLIFLPPDDDGVSGAISPPGGFRIFNRNVTAFYVRT